MRLTQTDLAHLVNHNGAKLAGNKPPEPKPAPKVTPPPAPAPDNTQALIAEMLRTQQKLADHMAQLADAKPAQISIQHPTLTFPPSRPLTQWIFDHEYDKRGDCVRTTATAVAPAAPQ